MSKSGLASVSRGEQVFDAHLGPLGTQGQQPHHAHVIDVADDEHRRQAGHVDMPELAILLGQARGIREPVSLPSFDQVAAPLAQPALVLRIGIAPMLVPLRIVPLLEQSAPEDRHEARELADARPGNAGTRCSSPRISSSCCSPSSRAYGRARGPSTATRRGGSPACRTSARMPAGLRQARRRRSRSIRAP